MVALIRTLSLALCLLSFSFAWLECRLRTNTRAHCKTTADLLNADKRTLFCTRYQQTPRALSAVSDAAAAAAAADRVNRIFIKHNKLAPIAWRTFAHTHTTTRHSDGDGLIREFIHRRCRDSSKTMRLCLRARVCVCVVW